MTARAQSALETVAVFPLFSSSAYRCLMKPNPWFKVRCCCLRPEEGIVCPRVHVVFPIALVDIIRAIIP